MKGRGQRVGGGVRGHAAIQWQVTEVSLRGAVQFKQLVLTLTMTLSVSSLGRNTQTQRRSCMALLLWKLSLFIFLWLGQDWPTRLGSGPLAGP